VTPSNPAPSSPPAPTAAPAQPPLDVAAIVRAYQDYVFRVFLRMKFPPSDASDLQQEVFVRLHALRHRSVPPKKVKSFLRGICLNVAKQHWRSLGLLPATVAFDDLPELPAAELDPEKLACHASEARRVDTAVDALDERQQIVLDLVADDLTIREIALCLGISEDAAEHRVRRAKDELKEQLALARRRERVRRAMIVVGAGGALALAVALLTGLIRPFGYDLAWHRTPVPGSSPAVPSAPPADLRPERPGPPPRRYCSSPCTRVPPPERAPR
jgi:RNA polymerase sigma factor (sigma-70 family)